MMTTNFRSRFATIIAELSVERTLALGHDVSDGDAAAIKLEATRQVDALSEADVTTLARAGEGMLRAVARRALGAAIEREVGVAQKAVA